MASGSEPNSSQKTIKFKHVLELETDYIHERRRVAAFDQSNKEQKEDISNAKEGDHPLEAEQDESNEQASLEALVEEQPIGLALSGGGIRSASLGLGFVQALRRYGIFRYIDYLSAISGGSYAGALVASSFYHCSGDIKKAKQQQSANLDIDLTENAEQPTRIRALAGNGRYLIRPIEWANRFFSGWFLLLLVVISALLSASALVAFLLRCMDFYAVRDYLRLLGFGGDLKPAVLPLFVLFGLWLVLWSCSRLTNGPSARGIKAKRVLILLVLCAIGTFAALIGNGDIALSTGVAKTANFLTFPLIVAIIGGLVPVFFRDRLFRSGRKDSTLLEKIIYRYTAVAVVLGIPMLLIGAFAREDISGFNASRDARLLCGDVKNFTGLANWFQSITSNQPTDLERLDKTELAKFANNVARRGIVRVQLGDAPAKQQIDIKGLINEISQLRAAHNELIDRVTGRGTWQAKRYQPDTILTIGGEGVDGVTRIEDDKNGVWQPRTEPWRTEIVSEPDADVVPGRSVLPLDPVSDPDAITWKDWFAWKYATSVHPWFLLAGHVVSGDSDDPFGLALSCGNRLLDREAKLLSIFNEVCLADRNFSKIFKLDAISKDDNLPKSFADQLAQVRAVGVASLQPDQVVTFNRNLMGHVYPEFVRPRSEVQRRIVIHADQTHRFFLFVVFGIVCILSACIINPNTTSIQRYYQEQLAGAYLGGSGETHNMRLTDLAPRMAQGPLLTIGGAANYRMRPEETWTVTDDEASAREFTERVDHFEFSPLACGSRNLGYVETGKYDDGRLRLADAVAISGAALNPMYFQRWEMLVIFGMLNLRLGQWLPNPASGTQTSRPTFMKILRDHVDLREKRFTSVKERRHILITDGGHYDNLGVQSLLERRCKVILVCDASQDEDFNFDDLALLLGRMKGKHGITLREIGTGQELDLGSQAQQFRDGHSHYFCAEIQYDPKAKAGSSGLLVYFKSSLSGDEAPFIWNHAQKHGSFPHDSTLNQAFQPEQFWAYLGLGQHFVDHIIDEDSGALKKVAKAKEHNARAFAELFLPDMEKERREEFLNHLFASESGQQRRREFRKEIHRVNEAVSFHDWDAAKASLLALDEMVRSLVKKQHEQEEIENDGKQEQGQMEQDEPTKTEPPFVPYYNTLLDRIRDAMAETLGDISADADRVRKDAGLLFVDVVEHNANVDSNREGRSEQEAEEFAVSRLASEIRKRFRGEDSVRLVSSVLLTPDCDPRLIVRLLDDNDPSVDLLTAELLSVVGDLINNGKLKPNENLRRLIRSKRLSTATHVRRVATDICRLFGDEAKGSQRSTRGKPAGGKGARGKSVRRSNRNR